MFKIKNDRLRESWEGLSPNAKRGIVVVSVVAGLFLFISMVTPDNPEVKRNRTREKQQVTRHVITDTDTRKIGMENLTAQVQALQREKQKLEDRIARNERAFKSFEDRVTRTKENDAKRAQSRPQAATATAAATGTPVAPAMPENPFDRNPFTDLANNPRTTRDGAPNVGFDIRVVTEGAGSDGILLAQGKVPGVDRQEREVYLPPGSILTVTLLNGIDAPTGQAAQREPQPVLVRVAKEAIMPNDFHADLRECFLLLGVYGRMDTERAYGRGETLSCIRNDGKVIETKAEGYWVGEDGKVGLRGRLVTKDGALIARAASAGFMQAFAQAFGGTPVPVIATGTPSGDVQYQDNISSDAAKYAAFRGTSTAFGKIADYYLKLADQVTPVLETDITRQVNFILTSGLALKLRD